jgi:hypothetical protein
MEVQRASSSSKEAVVRQRGKQRISRGWRLSAWTFRAWFAVLAQELLERVSIDEPFLGIWIAKPLKLVRSQKRGKVAAGQSRLRDRLGHGQMRAVGINRVHRESIA